MPYIVRLRNNATDEVREIQLVANWADISHFMWTDGTFGCDCNRAAMFARAGNEPDPEIPCSEFAYTAIEAVLPDGTRIVLDCDEASKR